MNVIEVRGLKKRYKEVFVVKGVTFDVKESEIFAFLGKNGAGKTTTVNMLTGICIPTEGEFFVNGISNKYMEEIKKHIGVMPDVSNYYLHMNAVEHLKFFAQLKRIKINREKIYHLLEQVGLEKHEKKKVGHYSFGMKKKLGVAQALIGEPKVIFLDEPTSGLDPESALSIQSLIKELSSKGLTIFMTSHNLHEVERICNRLAIMENGLISKIGTIEELKKRGGSYVEIEIKIKGDDYYAVQCLKKAMQNDIVDVYTDGGYIHCSLYHEDTIPSCVKVLCENGVSIYQLSVKTRSIEDVFFSQ
ncbi:ABC transporter ATP-binding protein [Anoxybacillus kestanbolensis]|uniref:ABC transporter ATP-binding protein n=1 Tax=Anoxybacillus kestanbolensis TaxID=227476 RepID=UPI003D24D174